MELSSQIAPIRSGVERAAKGLLDTFAAVPDAKLAWSPSETSRSSLWIMGHVAAANEAFARGILGEPMGPSMSMEEFGRMVWNAGKDTASRDEAVRLVEASTTKILQGLDALTPERMAATIDSPFGPIPMGVWITFAPDHISGHLHQIGYLQTAWGDLQNHTMV